MKQYSCETVQAMLEATQTDPAFKAQLMDALVDISVQQLNDPLDLGDGAKTDNAAQLMCSAMRNQQALFEEKGFSVGFTNMVFDTPPMFEIAKQLEAHWKARFDAFRQGVIAKTHPCKAHRRMDV